MLSFQPIESKHQGHVKAIKPFIPLTSPSLLLTKEKQTPTLRLGSTSREQSLRIAELKYLNNVFWRNVKGRSLH